MITRKIVADKVLSYLKHQISTNELVGWAENAVFEEEFEETTPLNLVDIVAKIGLANVANFGLLWEDCEKIMLELGYTVKIEAMLVSA